MTIIYHEEHADPSFLEGKKVAVIGYGALGQPIAFNLRDSGTDLVIGVRSPETGAIATADGFTVGTITEAVQMAEILLLMLPNEVMPPFYLEQISPHLRRGHTLIFGSAYNVTFRYIEPPPFVDVGLIAPRTMATTLREKYENNQDFQCFVSVGQDASGNAWNTVLAVASQMGALRGGAIEVSFEQEAELDLFAHQTLLPTMHHLLRTAAEVLLARGYPPEAVFTELYLSGELAEYLQSAAQRGLIRTLSSTSPTHQYGTISRIDRFSELKLERMMETTLNEIHSGDFAREWAKESNDGYRRLKNFMKQQDALDLWELEQQTLEFLGRGDNNET